MLIDVYYYCFQVTLYVTRQNGKYRSNNNYKNKSCVFTTVFELHSVLVFMKCIFSLYGKRIGILTKSNILLILQIFSDLRDPYKLSIIV